jgi:nickel-dependent lactate racemase
MVGIDFTINFVVDTKGNPIKAYAGNCDAVFSSCVKYGERNVWYRKVDQKSDVTVMACGEIADKGLENNPTYYMGLAMNVTKDDGTIILLLDEKVRDQRRMIDGVDIDQLSMSELLYMHERRNWRYDRRTIQHYIKSIRGSYYMRRNMVDHSQKLFIVSDTFSPTKLDRFRAEHFTDLNEAYQSALKGYKNPQVLIVPDAVDIFPLLEYSFPEEQKDAAPTESLVSR